MTKKTTKRALISSLLMLAICFTTLVGTTFAWFTDSASSTGNTIKTGKLDVELYTYDANNNPVNITDETAPIFDATTLWEPNATHVKYFQIKNAGNLALKFSVALDVYGVTKDLNKVMQYAVIPGADPVNNPVTAWNGGTDIEIGKNATDYEDIELQEEGDVVDFAIAIHMDHNAGNEYQMAQILFNINVVAAQLAYESDSFNNQYDAGAIYPLGTGSGVAVVNENGYADLEIRDESGAKVGSAFIPAEALAEGVTSAAVDIKKAETPYGNFTVADDESIVTYDVKVSSLKEGNTTPVKVTFKLPKSINPNTVKLYHYDQAVNTDNYVYDPSSGYVTVTSTSFSPFTVIHEDKYDYVVPAEEHDYPVANVQYVADYVNNDTIDWLLYEAFGAAEGLPTNLESAFKFSCPDKDANLEIWDNYKDWYCDFFVSLDRDLGVDEIFLGGSYGDLGWIGFHNGTVTLPANQEIGLLTSVTVNPWTYEMIYENVKEFICGVGDVNNALEGATFTVKLRLINPETVDTSVEDWWANLPEGSYIDVNVVTYKFGGNYTIDGVEG